LVDAPDSPRTSDTPSSARKTAGADRFRDGHRRNIGLGLLIICSLIALTAVFAMSAGLLGEDTLELTCLPVAPKEGQPTLIRLTIRNRGPDGEDYAYSMYINGELVAEGRSIIPPQSSRDVTYMIWVDIPVGESLRIYAEAQNLGSSERYERHVQIPPCPPEIWSSFSSFSSFSTSLLGYMTSFSYYMSFTVERTISSTVNAGAVLTMALLGVLVFLQISDPSWRTLGARTLSLRTRYGWLAMVLLAIFAAMVFTRIILIITGLG